MARRPVLELSTDFDYLLGFLPDGWQDKARELGALRRCRKVPDAETLFRVLMIHLAEGCSLRETAVRAREGGVIDLSDVAILDRLRGAGEWFRWMNGEILHRWVARQPATVYGERWKVQVVDATRVKEPGPTGSSWCLHYAIGLPSLECGELLVCDPSGSGETFRRFAVRPGDLFLADGVYGVRPGISHVVEGGGDVVVRFGMDNLPLRVPGRGSFDLLRRLRGLRGTAMGDWPVEFEYEGRSVSGRVCAVRKSRQATERAQKRLRRKARKDGTRTQAKTLEAAGYIFVFTTVEAKALRPGAVLEMYRGRWQIELVFKRLKSILGLGHLRKTDPDAARAWLQGKLLVALLIEALIVAGESFFPWGYPLCQAPGAQPVPVA